MQPMVACYIARDGLELPTLLDARTAGKLIRVLGSNLGPLEKQPVILRHLSRPYRLTSEEYISTTVGIDHRDERRAQSPPSSPRLSFVRAEISFHTHSKDTCSFSTHRSEDKHVVSSTTWIQADLRLKCSTASGYTIGVTPCLLWAG